MIPFKFEPYKHQIAMTEFGLVHPCCAFFSEMGTGKTKACIDLIRNRAIQNGVKKVLIIAPKSILGNWKREIEINTGNSLNVEIRILDGSKWERVQLLIKPTARLCFYIINYEGARIIKEDLIALSPDFVVCDESTRIKDIRAARTKACVQIGKNAPYRLIMTGTPLTQSPLDIHSQFLFLDNGKTFGWSFVSFRNKYFRPSLVCCPQKHAIYSQKDITQNPDGTYIIYCKKCGQNYPLNSDRGMVTSRAWKWECKPGALEEISKLIYTKAIRYTKKECLDLPPKIYETREIELNEEEQKIYNDMNVKLRAEISGRDISASIILTKLLRLSQITSGYATDELGVEREIENSSKLAELSDLIDEIDGKCIIWCHFIRNIKAVSNLLTKKGIEHVTFYSETKNRDEVIQRFQTDPNCKYFVGQTGTGGFGLNLTAANTVIYFSNGYSLEERLQSEDRCHRIGQEAKVVYIDIIAKNSIDESIIKAIRDKKTIADYVVDSWKEKK